MEKMDIHYEDWLAIQKTSLLSLVETVFRERKQELSLSDLERVGIAFDIAAHCHDKEDSRDS